MCHVCQVRTLSTQLRDHAETTSHLRFDGVVPIRKGFMAVESKGRDLFAGWFEAARVVTAVEVGGDGKAGLGPRGASVVEDLLVGIERLARPVPGDFREEAMLDRIPLGSTSRIVSDRHVEGKGVGQLGLDLGLPGVASAAVATAGIGEDQQLT